MTSPEDPTPPLTAEDPIRSEGEEGRARIGSNGLLGRLATRGVRKATATKHHDLRGERTEDVEVTNTFTGETSTETRTTHFPFIPATVRHNDELVESTSDRGGYEINTQNPLFDELRRGIRIPDEDDLKATTKVAAGYKHAVRSHELMIRKVRDSENGYVSLLGRTANKLLKPEQGRQAFLQDMYHAVNQATYEEVMAVPNSPIEGAGATRTWEDELNLYNIQALRAHLATFHHQIPADADPVKATNARRNGDIRYQALLTSGDLLAIDSFGVAAYLGVDADALRNQLQAGGTPVVPPEVLNKLRFFMYYAPDELPHEALTAAEHERGVQPEDKPVVLSHMLHEFNPNPPGTSAPMDRLQEMHRQAHQDIIDRMGFVPGRTAGVYANPNFDPASIPAPRHKELDPNASYEEKLARATKFIGDPTYGHLFDRDALVSLHEEIQAEAAPYYEHELNKINTEIRKLNSLLPSDKQWPYKDDIKDIPYDIRQTIILPIDKAHTQEYAGDTATPEVLEALTLARLIATGKLREPKPKKDGDNKPNRGRGSRPRTS